MNIKLNVTAFANGRLTSHSQHQIRSALEAELRRGIRLRHPLFEKLVKAIPGAAAKAVPAAAPHYLRLHEIHQPAKTPTAGGPCYMRIHENQIRLIRRTKP
jgi:hypothetical protein